MKNFTFFFLIVISFSSKAQTFQAQYTVSKDIFLSGPNGNQQKAATLQYRGYFYNNGSRYIFFKKPLYLEEFSQGFVQTTERSFTATTSLCMDTIQGIYYMSFDSSILRFRMDFAMGNKNAFETNNDSINFLRTLKPGSQKWTILGETKTINGLLCQKAKRLSTSGDPMWEIWFCPSIPMNGGICGLYDLPGLVVQAQCFPWKETYVLESYQANQKINGNVFWPAEFNFPFKGNNSSKQNVKQNVKTKKLNELLEQ